MGPAPPNFLYYKNPFHSFHHYFQVPTGSLLSKLSMEKAARGSLYVIEIPHCTTARLAQSVEHETLNLGVVGSSPTLGDYFESRSITRNGDCLDTNENRNAPSGTSCKRVGILFIVIARPLQTDFHTLLYYTFSSTNIMVCECQKRFLLKPFKPIKYVFGGKIIVFDKNALRVCQDSNLESSDP